ncbi:hypothetical protein AB0D13_36430 [Streptomyces sp. NPDC048430]|uniref:hypothetical protein n=1 Tax=Streptomyces sp. NPDC048430 TaxID=3155388 RepID=UPI0034285163
MAAALGDAAGGFAQLCPIELAAPRGPASPRRVLAARTAELRPDLLGLSDYAHRIVVLPLTSVIPDATSPAGHRPEAALRSRPYSVTGSRRHGVAARTPCPSTGLACRRCRPGPHAGRVRQPIPAATDAVACARRNWAAGVGLPRHREVRISKRHELALHTGHVDGLTRLLLHALGTIGARSTPGGGRCFHCDGTGLARPLSEPAAGHG